MGISRFSHLLACGFLALAPVTSAMASDTFEIALTSSEGTTVVQGNETTLSAQATVTGIDANLVKNTKY